MQYKRSKLLHVQVTTEGLVVGNTRGTRQLYTTSNAVPPALASSSTTSCKPIRGFLAPSLVRECVVRLTHHFKELLRVHPLGRYKVRACLLQGMHSGSDRMDHSDARYQGEDYTAKLVFGR